jgi:hypothetical protein
MDPEDIKPAHVDPMIHFSRLAGSPLYGPVDSGQLLKENFHKSIGNPMWMSPLTNTENPKLGRALFNPLSVGATPEMDDFINGGPTPMFFKKFEEMEKKRKIYDQAIDDNRMAREADIKKEFNK